MTPTLGAAPAGVVVRDRPSATTKAVVPVRPRGRTVRDCLIVGLGGQAGRVLGLAGALLLRRWLDPATLGLYSGLKLYLDQTNRSSLGIGQGASQEIPRLAAMGRREEAAEVADVAHTFTTLAVGLYALGLLAWAVVRRPLLEGDPLAGAWTWGLVLVAGLAPLQRAVTFRIAMLRARQSFGLPTTIDMAEGAVGVAVLLAGLALAGLPGLGLAVTGLLLAKWHILSRADGLAFRWRLDGAVAGRLLRRGLPIFVCTALFGAFTAADRVLVLWLLPEGTRAAGLYAVALLGASWAPDLAGRVVTVLDPHFQTLIGAQGGRSGGAARVAVQSTEALAALLGIGTAMAYLVGPQLLGWLLPAYREGLEALRPLLPGSLAVALSWPSRQLLIATGRTGALARVTLAGLAALLVAAVAGARWGGLPGLAAGTSAGQVVLLLGASLVAAGPIVDACGWVRHAAVVLALGFLPLVVAVGLDGLGAGVADRVVELSGLGVVCLAGPLWWGWKNGLLGWLVDVCRRRWGSS